MQQNSSQYQVKEGKFYVNHKNYIQQVTEEAFRIILHQEITK